jgi:hypothetical protein
MLEPPLEGYPTALLTVSTPGVLLVYLLLAVLSRVDALLIAEL